MLRTTVYLNEETVLAIKRLARIEMRPQSDLIRDAISEYVGKASKQISQALPPGTGGFRSGRSDVSTRADELLRRATRKTR